MGQRNEKRKNNVEKPFSGPSDPKLPPRIKKLPAKRRRQWVSVWNSIFKKCMSRSNAKKSTCEGKAFAGANASVKRSILREINQLVKKLTK